jgi:hypothetical protein
MGRGAIYVPTQLYYVDAGNPPGSIATICNQAATYSASDLAAFFYHPFLEFPFIEVDAKGQLASYDPGSYLHQLVACTQGAGLTFVGIDSLTPFVPSQRQTGLGAGDRAVLAGDVDGDGRSEIVILDRSTGTWSIGKVALDRYPRRYLDPIVPAVALNSWAAGDGWVSLLGDFNGDGRKDAAVEDSVSGAFQVALSDGASFHPSTTDTGDPVWLRGSPLGAMPFAADMNGDRRDDILLYDSANGRWLVSISTGSGFAAPQAVWLSGWAIGSSWRAFVGDFDGNGLGDVAVLDPQGGWQVALSDGTRLVPAPGASDDYVWLSQWGAGAQWVPFVGDFNADGKSDLVVVIPADGDWQVALGTGSSFQPASTTFVPWSADPQLVPIVGRFSADGRASIGAYHPSLRGGTIDFAVSMLGRN